ncbi:UDP binding domain-containing protein [Tistrella bauzanensis]
MPDLRNSKVPQLAARLSRHGFQVDLHDPLADRLDLCRQYGLDVVAWPENSPARYDLLVLAVGHQVFLHRSLDHIAGMIKCPGLIADIKGVWRGMAVGPNPAYWTL